MLFWEYSARAFQWIPTWQGLNGFWKSFRPCALDKSSLSIGRFNTLPAEARNSMTILVRSVSRKQSWENIWRSYVFTTLPTTFLQVLWRILPYSQVIVKSMINPDENILTLMLHGGCFFYYTKWYKRRKTALLHTRVIGDSSQLSCRWGSGNDTYWKSPIHITWLDLDLLAHVTMETSVLPWDPYAT